MGTRADFYIAKDIDDDNKQLTWIGSIAYDGYPGITDGNGVPSSIIHAAKELSFKRNVNNLLKRVTHGTFPKDGWPWPWEDSTTSDYAYVYYQDEVFISAFHPTEKYPAYCWVSCSHFNVEAASFLPLPDMTDKSNNPKGD